MHPMVRTIAFPAVMAAAVFSTACQDAGTTGATTDSGVSLSFVVGTGSAAGASRAPSQAETVHTLALSHVQVVLSRVRLRQTGVSNDSIRVCDTQPAACPEFRAGPVLVDLPLAGGVITPFSKPIPPGSYSRLIFNIRPPQGADSAATAFRTANNWPATGTIRVQGTYDGQAFDLYLRTVAEMVVPLDPPFVVSASGAGTLNVTVAVDATRWFKTEAGAVIDPRALTSSPQLLAVVENNIRASIRAFNDNQRKGKDK